MILHIVMIYYWNDKLLEGQNIGMIKYWNDKLLECNPIYSYVCYITHKNDD
jgi:hypothetical protein